MRDCVKTLQVAAMLLAAALPLGAQTLTGSISGTVLDEQGGVLPGATVTLTGKAGSVTATTDARGDYRFPTVDPGAYSVQGELSGFQPHRVEGLRIVIGRQLTVDLSLKVAAVAEAVDVTAEASLVDVTSSATSEGISQDLLFNIPISRFAPELLNYTPGINQYSAFGGGTSANGFYLDGVSTRSPGGGDNYVYLNYNTIEDFQVQGLGAPAEYGSFTGAVINYVSRSGGNRFSALFDLQYTDDGLGSDNVTDEIEADNPSLGDPQKTTKLVDVTAQLSGPLVKDKLFFFLSAQRYQLDYDPPGPRAKLGEVTPRLNAKLTWQPRSSDTLTAVFQGEDYNRTGRANGITGAASTTDALSFDQDSNDRLWSLQWRHLFGSRTFLEAKYHGYTAYDYRDPKVREPIHYVYETGAYTGGGGYYFYADRKQHQVNIALSHFAEAFGQHDLKFGLEVERSRTRDRSDYIGGLYYYDYYGPYLAYSYGYDITGDNHRESAFAQDSWKVNERLTVNAGVRVDWVSGFSPDTDSDVYSNTNWAPRLGVAWDATGDHKTVLKAFWGRYYEGILQYQYYRLLPGTRDFVTYDMTSGEPVEIDRDFRSVGSFRLDPDIGHPRVDEFTAGLERALSADVRLSVTGVLRRNKNFIGSVIPSARWAPTQVTSGLTGQPLTAYNWANPDESASDLLITNPDGFVFLEPDGSPIGTLEASSNYKGLILSLEKRLSKRWQGRISYVLSKGEGTVDPATAEHIGYGGQFETPTLALVNTKGQFYYSQPHELKLFFSYEIPKIDLNVNAYYRLISGETYTAYQRYSTDEIDASPASRREPWIEPRGTRRLDSLNLLDLRIEKTFRVPGGRLGIYADLYNAFNKSIVDEAQQRYPSISIDGSDVPFAGPTSVVAPRQVTFGARWSF
ncbi:MAG TPA: TonB-dependent receptor [Dehalococcoidia bacterium]